MIVAVCILCILCIGQAMYVYHIRKQLSEWLDYLKNIRKAPEQKSFVKDRGILAEINYEMNDILAESRKQFVRLIKAEEANKQILTNLSHDVRTPLASLIGYLEALEQGRVKENERKEYISVAYKKALNLKELVDNLFEWFKINSNEQEYEIKEYDVNELTRQIVIGYLPIVEDKKISLEVDIPDEEWFLLIDKIAYERVINNLFSNALKHGKCSRIKIGIKKSNDMAVIEVYNNGVTIPKEELPYIFERLYKCDSARSQSGNGLGLAIVKELVTAMHGNIEVTSMQGEKTSFFISFLFYVRKK